MTKEEIGNVLKQLRNSRGMTQREVADKIGRTQQIIGHWETGYSQPDANTLFILCDIYGTTVDEAFGFKKTSKVLSEIEKSLIDNFKKLDESGKNRITHFINAEMERVEKEKELSNAIDSLRFENERLKRMTRYSYMHNIASAGSGFYYQDIPVDTIEAPYKEGADFIIGVSGDSMEPTFYDGDKVYVRKTNELDIGKIGIFLYNNECFIKEKGEDSLISHNKKYPEMIPAYDVRLIGEVLGKVEEN